MPKTVILMTQIKIVTKALPRVPVCSKELIDGVNCWHKKETFYSTHDYLIGDFSFVIVSIPMAHARVIPTYAQISFTSTKELSYSIQLLTSISVDIRIYLPEKVIFTEAARPR